MSEENPSQADKSSMGGKKAAANMTPAERKARGKKAADARWMANLPKVTHGGTDHPLVIGEIEINCYVLDDGRRVISQRGLQSAIGISGGGGAPRLLNMIDGFAEKGLDCRGLAVRIQEPIKFVLPDFLSAVHGYEATALADLCDLILDARKAGLLIAQRMHIADNCELLVRAFARVGIIALIDEATGYQYDRPRKELEQQLRKFIAESLRRWVRTFPSDYFKHLCRLRGVELRPDMRLPQYFGHLTNDLVYRRLAPGLVRRLKDRRQERGKPSNKLHSWLSEDTGFPEVLVHLGTVVGLMKVHTDYDRFEKQLSDIAPQYPEVPGLFDDPTDWK